MKNQFPTNEEFFKDLDETAVNLLAFKGFNLETEEGLEDAAGFLENATWDDAFYSEGGEYNEIDEFFGNLRLQLMREAVEARL